MIRLKFSISIFLFIFLLGSTACKWSNRAKGGTIGAGSGAVIGGAIGKKAGNTTAGILIGAAVGGTTGFFIGKYMDKQAEEIRQDLSDAKIERIGEGVLITFNASPMFDVNSFQLGSSAKNNLQELATILQKYDDTEIVVQGHTDSSGSADYNFDLSEKRAKNVRNYLVQNGVKSPRFTIEGYGEAMPVASNDTASGKQQNRRVELAIYANKKLKKAAKKGELQVEGD